MHTETKSKSKSTLLQRDPGEAYAHCVADLERHANLKLTDTEVIAQVLLIVGFSADTEARAEVEALERGHKAAAGIHRLAVARKRRLGKKLAAMRALIIGRGHESLAELLAADPTLIRPKHLDSGFDV